jgi:antitoxin component YwqK of YwqJK toxin-antitoxin module
MRKIKQKKWFVIFLTFISVVTYSQSVDAIDNKGLRHGLQKGYYSDTKKLRYEGNFNHGKEQGIFTYYANSDKNIVMATRNFNNKGGAYTIFYDEKKNVVSEGNTQNKLRQGAWKYYHKESKAIMTTENYVNDKIEGVRKVFYIDGKVAEEVPYKNDKKEGVSKKYSNNSELIEQATYKAGLLQGDYKIFEETGEIAIEGKFNNDLKKGLWKYYQKGKLFRQVNVDTIKGFTKPPIRKKE